MLIVFPAASHNLHAWLRNDEEIIAVGTLPRHDFLFLLKCTVAALCTQWSAGDIDDGIRADNFGGAMEENLDLIICAAPEGTGK